MPSLPDTSASNEPTGGAWALPLLALGLGLIACCFIIPATDDNRILVFERERIRMELATLTRQIELNEEFLGRIHSDHDLALRLASRQRWGAEEDVAVLWPTRPVRPGGGGLGNFSLSPFALLVVPPQTAAVEPVPPAGGRLAQACRHPRARLVVLGTGLFACMLGLLAGGGRGRTGAD
jgi:hypothetical protein